MSRFHTRGLLRIAGVAILFLMIYSMKMVSRKDVDTVKVESLISENDRAIFKVEYNATNFPQTAEKLRVLGKYFHMFKGANPLSRFEMTEFIDEIQQHIFSWIKPKLVKSLIELPTRFKGRGIVLCVYNGYVPFALATIRMIRETHRSDIPIEIFHMGDNDLSPANRNILTAVPHVTCHNIHDYVSVDIGGWAIKPFAMLSSSFDEAVLLDADVVFLQSPEKLFEYPEYKQNGALFFHDRSLYSTSEKQREWAKSLMEQPFRKEFLDLRFFTGKSAHEMESGVVVIKKSEKFLGLLATCWMNGKTERDKVTYRNMHGDKETYWLGFELIKESYEFVKHLPGNLGQLEDGKVCGCQMTHRDWDGKPFWVNNFIVADKFVRPPKPAIMEYWAAEPGTWSLHENNRACIESDTLEPVNEELNDVLEKNIGIYLEVVEKLK